MQWVIEAEDIVKYYGTTCALDHVTVRVKQGEMFGFLGPNGAGKTTLIKILLNVSFADTGYVKLFNIDNKKARSRQKVGFLPEILYCYPYLTVEEFLIFHAKLIGIKTATIPLEVTNSLKRLDIINVRNNKIGTLSKGIKQRVGIAQALLGAPGLVLLDEPTSGMDPIGIKEVREILLDLQRNGTTIFINSHLLSEIERICDRIAIINNGKIIADGNKEELSIQTKHLEITGEYLTDEMIFEINKLSKQTAQLQDGSMKIYPQHEDDALTIHQIIATLGGRIHSLTWVSESLEDIFYRLIKHEDK